MNTGNPSPAQASSVAVVIPTYNRRNLLAQTLATVLAQRPCPHEVIVVDDGSTDGTGELLKSAAVTVVFNQRGGWGPAKARDEGAKIARSELIAFLDSDDLLLPGALGRLARALRETPNAPFAFGRCLTAVKENGRWRATGLMAATPEELRDPLLSLFARNYVPSVGSMARKSAIAAIGGYPDLGILGEDHYFWLRLAQIADPVFVPALTAVYREHVGSRHSPVVAGSQLEPYLRLAAADRRLAQAVPDRLGVALCDSLAANVAAGKRAGAMRVVWRNLVSRRHRVKIMRRARRHWQERRRWAQEGVRLWESDDELREWLSHH